MKWVIADLSQMFPLKESVKEQRVDGSYCDYFGAKKFALKVYSKGFRKKLSNQSPF